jgi:hypothetical protein
MKILNSTILALALGGVMTVATVPALASTNDSGDSGAGAAGSCSASSTWKLKSKLDDGRIEFEAEVDSNVNGQVWRWALAHNGELSAHGHKITKAPSGSFKVRRLLVNADGRDKISFRAKDHATGEVCKGQVSL